MDCRKGLCLALGLWGASAGCQHQEIKLPPGAAPQANSPLASAGWQYKAPADPPKKTPKPETLVKFADFRVKESVGTQYTQSQRESLLDEARISYQEALKLDSKYVPAYLGLARMYATWDNYPKALTTYQKGLQAMPKDASLWYGLGLCYNHTQEMDKAIDALKHAVELDPENRNYANALAVLLARGGRYQDSLDCFARVNGPAMAYFKLGATLHHLDQPQLSRRCLETALEKNPKLNQAQEMLAEMNSEQPPTDSQQPVRTVGHAEPQPDSAPAPDKQ